MSERSFSTLRHLLGERLTPRQAARLLHVHEGTIWRWMLAGVRGYKLAFFHIGSRRYIAKPALDKFLAACNERKVHLSIGADPAVDEADAEIRDARA